MSHCTPDLLTEPCTPIPAGFLPFSFCRIFFCQISGTSWTIRKTSQGLMGCVCINISIHFSEEPGFICLWGRRVSVFSGEQYLTPGLLRSRAALGHMAQHGDPFTTFAVILEECFLQPASCVMENSMSSMVIPGCHTAV